MHGLNTYDHGARQNYSILGRWDRIDPRCEDYYDLSPYVFQYYVLILTERQLRLHGMSQTYYMM